jgi:hypothetical protein
MKNNKIKYGNRRSLIKKAIVEVLEQKDLPLERRYPGPNRLQTKVDWDRLGPAAVGTSSTIRRRRQRLIPMDDETREQIIQDLRSRGIID